MVPCAGAFLLGSVYCEAAHLKSSEPQEGCITASPLWLAATEAWAMWLLYNRYKHIPSENGLVPCESRLFARKCFHQRNPGKSRL
jgi:hypothetical protein